MSNIGFIGLGHMGSPMVKCLLKASHQVKVFDLSNEAMRSLVALGAQAVNSPGEAAKDSDFVFTMLQTGDQVLQCCEGESGIFSHIIPNALYIDSSSIDIGASRKIHQLAECKGIAMLDAPVSGGVAAAEKGSLTFMVGGLENDFKQANPILNVMGKKIIYAGKAGNGAAAKICNNMILGVSMIAVSEGFNLANKLGLSAEKLFEICSNASASCWSLTQNCPAPNIIPNVPSSNNYQPGFAAKMMLKDLNLSQNAAKGANAQTPLGQHAFKLYQQFIDEGNSEIDFSGIIKMLS